MMTMTGGLLSVEKEPVKAADASESKKNWASKPRYFIYVTALYKNSGVIR
jgi:hypothetical protein